MTINSISFAGNSVEQKKSSAGKKIAAAATIGGGAAFCYAAVRHGLNKNPLAAYETGVRNFKKKYERKFGIGSIKDDVAKFRRFADKFIGMYGDKLKPAGNKMKALGVVVGATLGGLVFAAGCGIKALFSRNKD